MTVSYEAPDSPHSRFYHGEDLNLHHPDYATQVKILVKFYAAAMHRFDWLHITGDGCLSFFPEFWQWQEDLPYDMQAWKRAGKWVSYTISGCFSGIRQDTFADWTRQGRPYAACDHCKWRDLPDLCSGPKPEAWGRTIRKHCDLISAEAMPALDYLDSPQTVFDPLTMCLDPDVWSPMLPIPEKFVERREPGELLVYHGVGNYQARTDADGKNIKGTGAIIAAVDRLRAEGVKVRLIFATDLTNLEVRYLQAQADVIVDQLLVGRYGATAREGMMLGKPVICYLNLGEPHDRHTMRWKDDIPLVSATPETVYEALKSLLGDADRRRALGEQGRRYALKWHSADACAERYEGVYDSIKAQRRSARAAGSSGRPE